MMVFPCQFVPHPLHPHPQQAPLIIAPMAMPAPKEMMAAAAMFAELYPGTTIGAP